MPFGQGIFPASGYMPWGSVTGYNFDPMMGQPLRPNTPYSFLFMSQSLNVLFASHLSLPDLPSLLNEEDEDTPLLVVEPHPVHLVL